LPDPQLEVIVLVPRRVGVQPVPKQPYIPEAAATPEPVSLGDRVTVLSVPYHVAVTLLVVLGVVVSTVMVASTESLLSTDQVWPVIDEI